MKFCIKCGQQASSDDQKFCRFCGTEFPAIVLSHAAEEDNHEKDFTSGDGPDIKGETIGKSTDDGDSSVKIFFQEKQKPQEPEKGQWSTPQAKSDEQKEENATDSVPPSETTSQVPLQTVDSCRDRPPFGRFKGKIIGIITALLILSCIAGFGGWFYIQNYSIVGVGGEKYSIKNTTMLKVEEPDETDWNAIGRLTSLTSLTIVGGPDTPAVTEENLQSLAGLKMLDELVLDDLEFETAPVLPDLQNLSILRIQGAGLTSEQCFELPPLPNLDILDLSNNELSEIGFLDRFSGLRELDVTDNVIVQFGALNRVSELETLAIDHIRVQDLSALPNLQNLTIGSVQVENVTAFKETQQANVDVAETLIQQFEDGDYASIHNWLAEYFGDNSDLVEDEPIWYNDGWFMYIDDSWDVLRNSIAPAAKVLIIESNGAYYGCVENDVRAGDGVQCFTNNDSYYSGAWLNDLPNGSGIYYKTAANGSRLEYAGLYVNGYEDGAMTLTVNGTSSIAYSADNGIRTILEERNGSYVYAQQGDTYWCCADPTGHGVPIGSIPYQEEFSIEIAPVAQTSQPSQEHAVQSLPSSPAPEQSESADTGGGFSSDDIFYIVDGDEVYTIHGDEIYPWPADVPWPW